MRSAAAGQSYVGRVALGPERRDPVLLLTKLVTPDGGAVCTFFRSRSTVRNEGRRGELPVRIVMKALWGLIISVVELCGFAHAAHAVLHARTSQGAIAWAVSLVTFPWVALPLYWIFGRSKFAGYVRSRRSGSLRVNELARRAIDGMMEYRTELPSELGSLFRSGELLEGLPATAANNLDLLIDGGAAFSVMLEAIAAAQRYVLVQFFIVEEGRLSNEYRRVLAERAAAGVAVYFLYDEFGSRKLPRRYLRELQEAGIHVSPFKTSRGVGNRFRLNFRNHRKVTVVDGRMAFLGGLNLGDEYIRHGPRTGAWRDTHVRVCGPAVQCVQLAFLEDWHWATGQIPELEWQCVPAQGRPQRVLVMPTGPADELETCKLLVLSIIHSAQRRLWIASPYFVPGPEVTAALQLAVVRGVDVRVILPDHPDHLLVYLASFSYYREMMQAGVRLYRYGSGFMHQKVILVDDDLTTVGTANLDSRSFRLNFEITLLAADREFAADIQDMLRHDLEHCRRAQLTDFTERGLLFRLSVHLARLFAPVL